eukprot:280580_1
MNLYSALLAHSNDAEFQSNPILSRGIQAAQGIHRGHQLIDAYINRNCPGKHGLKRFRTPTRGFGCDGCQERPYPKDAVLFGCRACNYDLCYLCFNRSGDVDQEKK